ncbi:S8 family serine peptidase [Conexibacter woesei]|uniref:S8 family serine peptidase n=1 Tax=Conexibacter woesei TaxID=191495 RepID=UPI00041B59CA|nr:S8 family serine peptidase [Conexibacter woesei]
MRSPRTLLFALLVVASLVLPAVAAADTARPYIVVFERSSAPAARAATSEIAEDQDLTTTQRYDDAVHGFAAKLDSGDVRELKNDPRVAEVVPDKPVRMTSLVPLASGDNIPTGVRRVGGAVGTTVHQASTANVAVVDTGVDLTHPDLNAVAGTNCVGSGAPQDDNGHGTHVAGIIGAKNQGSGAVGVAPGTKIYAVKVLNASGSGYTSQIVCGLDWVTATRTDSDPNNDISVVNMSLGGGSSPTANCGTSVGDVEHMAICRATAAGVTFVVAAGNSNTDEQSFAPANEPEVLTVTSVSDSDGLPGGVGGGATCGFSDGDDTPASYSNYATRAAEIAHTLAAPGTCIRSTYRGGMYATMSGTSMASPHVAGLVALCMGENGAHGPCWGKTPAQVIRMMIDASTTAAAQAPNTVFSGSPSKPLANGRYYGDLASTVFPSAPGLIPVNTAAPTESGTAVTGQTLTGGTGTWSGSGNSYTYDWVRCTTTSIASCSAIAGATGQTYTLVSGDVGRYVRFRVRAANSDGAGLARSAATVAVTAPVVVAPAVTAAPALSGSATVGATLTGTNGRWSGTAPFTYSTVWLRCNDGTVGSCTALSGQSASTYTLTAADKGKYLRFQVTARNAKAAVTTRSVATPIVTGPPPPANSVLPTINGTTAAGTLTVGTTLTGSQGTWSGSPTSYPKAWLRCTTTTLSSCAAISGSTAATYVATAADRGRYLRFQVTATNPFGSTTVRSNTMLIR